MVLALLFFWPNNAEPTAVSAPVTTATSAAPTTSAPPIATTHAPEPVLEPIPEPIPIPEPAPESTIAPPPPPVQTPPPVVNKSVADEVIDIVNRYRAEAGCGPLEKNVDLTHYAEIHTQEQASKQTMKHSGGPYAENVAYGTIYDTPEKVMNGWMNSPGHRANILTCSFTQIGVGYVQDGPYWTQEFGG